MLLARCLLSSTLLVTFAATAGDATEIPSDPRSWDMEYLGLPAGSAKCPGGEIQDFRNRVPSLRPHTPQEYESTYQTSLKSLRGLRDSDQIYPFYYRWDLPNDQFAGVGGYIVARGQCIIHVQATLYDN